MNASPDSKRAGWLTGPLIFGLFVALLGGAMLLRLTGNDSPPSWVKGSKEAPLVGHLAPDFTLPDLEGEPVSLSDWRGQPVLINFWASWCGPCEVEMPDIQAAYEIYREQGLVVLAVAVEDTPENVRQFFDRHGLTFRPLMDDGAVSRAYQVFGIPTSFFVDGEGRVVDVHTGLLTEQKIADYMARGE